ncbi:hypothetical protein GCM10025777_53080 [Membranihabitans marinus]
MEFLDGLEKRLEIKSYSILTEQKLKPTIGSLKSFILIFGNFVLGTIESNIDFLPFGTKLTVK